MKIFIKFLILLTIFYQNPCMANTYTYILNDKCINDLFAIAKKDFTNTDIKITKDPRGIILSFELEKNIDKTFKNDLIIKNIDTIEYFLAKIENPAIIEVHTEAYIDKKHSAIKNWEVATVIANKIESIILNIRGRVSNSRIHSVGYGEFMPAKNTSNNGGKYSNRVDIIILCNISGE